MAAEARTQVRTGGRRGCCPCWRCSSAGQTWPFDARSTYTETLYTIKPGLGSILDTVSEDTEDTAHLYLINISLILFQALLLMVSVSKYLKDTEDTAPHVSVS